MNEQTLWLRRIFFLILVIGVIGLPMAAVIGFKALGKAERIVVIVEEAKAGLAPAGKAMVDKTINAVEEIDPTEMKDGFKEIGGVAKEGVKGLLSRTFGNQEKEE